MEQGIHLRVDFLKQKNPKTLKILLNYYKKNFLS